MLMIPDGYKLAVLNSENTVLGEPIDIGGYNLAVSFAQSSIIFSIREALELEVDFTKPPEG